MSAALSAIGLLILPWVVNESEILRTATWYLVVFVPFYSVGFALNALDQGRMRFARYNLGRLLPAAIYLVGLCVVWGLGKGSVSTFLVCKLIGVISMALILVALARQELCVAPSIRTASQLFATGLKFHVANVFTVLRGQLDSLLIISFYGAGDIGFYVVALAFARVPLQLFSGAFASLLFVRVSQGTELDQKGKVLAQSARYATLFFGITALGLAFVAPLLVPAVFGSAFRPAVKLAEVLPFALAISALRDLYVLSLMGLSDWKIRLSAELLMIAVFVAAVLFLSSFGVIGVAIALLVANLSSLLLILILMRRWLGLELIDHWGGNVRTAREVFEHAKRVARAARYPDPVR